MPKRKSWVKAILILGGVLVIGLIIFVSHSQAESSPTISSQDYATTDSSSQDSLNAESVNAGRLKSIIKSNQVVPIDTSNLDSQINAIIEDNPDISIGVSIQDTNTGSFYNYGNLGPMTAASVTKVLTATDYMKEVELGHKSLDTIMVDGNSAEYDIEQMIVVSDNDAWHVLNDSLTYTQLQAYAESLGLTSYYYADNIFGVSDNTKLLGNLYGRKLINESHTQLLLSYMERANYRGLIIPAIPEYDTVYHKAGTIYAFLHDGTIITNSTKAIALSIFTESLYSFDSARVSSIMQQITTPTLETFQLN